MRNLFFYLLLLLGIALILYLSWIPQPKIGTAGFIPGWLADWADAGENDTLRTGVPFLFLGIFIGTWLTSFKYQWHGWIVAWLGLLLLVLLAEAGQLFLPNRRFDWLDVFWGAAGGLLGLALAKMAALVAKR
jgi:hypothetical protein